MAVRSWNRLLFRWRRDRFYRELAEELEFHRALASANRCGSTDGTQVR